MEHRCHLGKKGTQCGQDPFLQAGFEGFTADKLARDLIEVLERKIKKCKSHREREVLRYAQHLLQCNGCEKDRLVIEIEISRKCKSKYVLLPGSIRILAALTAGKRKVGNEQGKAAHLHIFNVIVILCSDLKGKPLLIFRFNEYTSRGTQVRSQ